jgi:hypothetical protein
MSSARAHVTWVISLLVVLLLGVLSVRFSDVPNFYDKLAILATGLSVVLALLAIIQGSISNASLSNSIGTVSASSTDLSRSTGDLRTASDQIKREIEALPKLLDQLQRGVEDKLRENSESFRSASTKLNDVVVSITDVTKGLEIATSSIRDQTQTLPFLLDNLGGRLGQQLEQTQQLIRDQGPPKAAATPATSVDPASVPDSLAKRFLKYSSIHGGFMTLAFAEAKARGLTKIDFRKLTAAVDSALDVEYLFGYAIASSAVGIMSISVNSHVYTIKDLHPVVQKEARPAFIAALNRKDTEKEKARFTSWIDKLDTFLSTTAKGV